MALLISTWCNSAFDLLAQFNICKLHWPIAQKACGNLWLTLSFFFWPTTKISQNEIGARGLKDYMMSENIYPANLAALSLSME